MKIIKPIWIKHEYKGKSIFSIDIHPDGTRFATGGQGNDCGRVTVWNLAAVISADVENDENQPKLLCQIDSHLQCVNSVRWSHSGDYLASAGDDKLIMIWKMGGKYQDQTEQYKTVSTLRSHSGDILDLSWSQDDQYLASCSVDNMIVIWNAQRWPEITKILKGHCGLVKGVTWDPIGKYLASQSADKTLRVWRISDWSEEIVIKEPFEQCGDTTHVLRVSWSPDGQYLVSAQAMNGGGSVAKIIDRQDWSFVRDFVGHRKAIPCSRFNSNIFKFSVASKKSKSTENNENQSRTAQENGSIGHQQKLKPHCVCALGSRDRSLSIWSTARSRPLVVIDDVVDSSVVDLSWSKCGYYLLACSLDGSVICLEFNDKELGLTYNLEERVQYLQQLYGTSLFTNKNSISNRLIEDVDILMLQTGKSCKKLELANGGTALSSSNVQNKPEENKNVSETTNDVKSNVSAATTSSVIENNKDQHSLSSLNRPPPNTTSPGRLAKGPTDKQIEIRSADGRRRIIPLFIPPTKDTNSSSSAAGKDNQEQQNGNSNHQLQKSSSGANSSLTSKPITFSSSSESKSKIVIETLDESNPAQNLQAYQYLNSNSLPATASATQPLSQPPITNNKDLTLPSNNNRTLEQADTKSTEYSSTIVQREKSSTMPATSTIQNGNNQQQQQQRQQKSEQMYDSSDDDVVVLRRSKSLKRPKLSSTLNDSPPQNQSQSSLQPPVAKRKPGRPPGALSNQIPTETSTMAANQTAEYTQKISSKLSSAKIVQQQQPPTTTVNAQQEIPNSVRVASVVSSSTSAGSLFFPPLRLGRQNHSSVKLFTKIDDDTRKVFSASIEYPLASSGICKLSLISDDDVCLWSVMVSNPILALAANDELVACFCDDQSVHVYQTLNGRRLHVPIILESLAARMVCANKTNLLVITCNAHVWLWDLSVPKILVRGESLVPVLIDPRTSEQMSIQSASVSITMKPIVTVSNGRTYIFENDLQSWCLLNDLNDPLNACTDLRPCAINSIKHLASYTKFPSRSLLNFYSSNVTLTQKSVLSFIEKQMEVAKLLGSADEFRYWVVNLVQHLVLLHSSGGEIANMENVENRLREICTALLGSRFPSRSVFTKNIEQERSTKTINIQGLNKHELLRDILNILTGNLSLQRLYLEFKDLLESFTNPPVINSNMFLMSAKNPNHESEQTKFPTMTITTKPKSNLNIVNNNNHHHHNQTEENERQINEDRPEESKVNNDIDIDNENIEEKKIEGIVETMEL